MIEAVGIFNLEVKRAEIERNTRSEGALLGQVTDADLTNRKLREQMGLDTPVVLAVNDGN